MKHLFSNIFFGDQTVRDYATIRINGNIREKVFLRIAGIPVDITSIHWPLALQPFVFGVWAAKNGPLSGFDKMAGQEMVFTRGLKNGVNRGKDRIATLTLDFFDSIEGAEGELLLMKIRRAGIQHGHFLKWAFIFFKYFRKPGLSFAQFRAFVAAYSFPRVVKIISYRDGGYFNIFPMDLLGKIEGTNKFVFGLRHTNSTLLKIIETKKLVVSGCAAVHKDAIYGLGKHHGSAPPGLDSLPFTVMATSQHGFLIPSWVEDYSEIRILKTMNLGSHMLLWGEAEHLQQLADPSGHLFHMHFLVYLMERSSGDDYPLA